MYFEVDIDNLGKLSKADIRLGKFTVFAGLRNTGKSLAAKAIYSVFAAMNDNHTALAMRRDIKTLQNIHRRVEQDAVLGKMKAPKEMPPGIAELLDVIRNISVDDKTDEFDALTKALPALSEAAKNIYGVALRLRDAADAARDFHGVEEKDLRQMVECADNLRQTAAKRREEIIVRGMSHQIRDNLLGNFRVGRLDDLHDGGRGVTMYISNVGEVFAYEDGKIDVKLKKIGLHKIKKLSGVLYLDMRLRWEAKNPPDLAGQMPRFLFSDNSDKGDFSAAPKYVYDMYGNLGGEGGGQHGDKNGGEMLCPDVFARLTGKDVLGGKLVIADSGNELLFQKGDRATPPHLAADGAANLALLALLIERNLLAKNSLLFVDEPEANLPPAWQVETAKALYELSQAGVNVVLATRSEVLLEWLLELRKKNPQAEKDMELNLFPANDDAADNGKSA